jgi:hypothetical protein
VRATQDFFPEVNRSSHWTVMGLMLLYLILIGPLDYLLVHRVLKKPHLTWLTFPLLVAAAAGLTIWSARSVNGNQMRLNQLDVVDLSASEGTLRARSWLTLYSPRMQRYDVGLEPDAGWGRSASEKPSDLSLCWYGVPEDGFGGMYRPAGLEMNLPAYSISPDRDVIDRLPILQWSTRTLTGRWHHQGEPLVRGDLKASALGRLSGTLTHRLPVPIEDWVLAYGNRIYWTMQPGATAQIRPLVPNVPWSPAEPTVNQRELRGYLTGARAREVDRRPGQTSGNIIHEQTPYDPLNLNEADLWQMLTFHEAAGGSRYTRLTNFLLDDLDLSRELRLGRAVLFGRISRPAARPTIDGEPTEPTHQTTFVRLVLPVERSSEPVLLEKLD